MTIAPAGTAQPGAFTLIGDPGSGEK